MSRREFLAAVGGMALSAVLLKFDGSKKLFTAFTKGETEVSKKNTSAYPSCANNYGLLS